MAGEVYVSGVFHIGELGDKLGVRVKYQGENWQPAEFKIPPEPQHVVEAVEKAASGHKLSREEFPEGVAIWNEKAFAKARDILWAGGFLTVSAKIADVLSRFDLGGGELVPVPLFKADLETPWPEPYYYINFGGPKGTFVPEDSGSVRPMIRRQPPSKSTYRPQSYVDGGIALSPEALRAADIWMEKFVWHELFLSGELVAALQAAKIDVDLRLAKCRIVEAAR